MSEFIKVSEAATRWGISERRIAVLCKNDRIPGAYKNGRSWELPADGRIKSGIYVQSGRSAVLRLPVGVSGYVEAVSEYYYVDKTLLIKDYLAEWCQGHFVYPPSAIRQDFEYGYAQDLF
ncbi:MAG: hypothetical protein IKD69_03810 [Solobacterium sp.]|nr:hypothetical protein [Solobacterium sp.]